MSVEAVPRVPELVWPPYPAEQRPGRPAWDAQTQALSIIIPAPTSQETFGNTLTTTAFEPAAPAVTDQRVDNLRAGLDALYADRGDLVTEQYEGAIGGVSASMTERAGSYSGDNSDAEGLIGLGILPTAAPVRIRHAETTRPGDIDPAEIGRRAAALAAFSQGRDRGRAVDATPEPADAPRQAETVVIPGRTQVEQPIQQTRVVDAEVASHRRPSRLRAGLLGAQLLVNRVIQRTIGGRGRHSAPGRNNY